MTTPFKSLDFMTVALHEAEKAFALDEVPVGAVLVSASGEIIAQGHNLVETSSDPSRHAELVVIQEAARSLKTKRLVDCDLYVTLEPCPMCAHLISMARIRHLIFGAFDPKGGGIFGGAKIFDQKTCTHRPLIYGGVREEACGQMLKSFFQMKRLQKTEEFLSLSREPMV